MAKRALLIGINRYQIPGADLRGCVNDVKNMASALEELCGFRPADIETLTDLEATKKTMEAGIKKLVKGGRKGDVLLLHYSGHGSNVPDDDGDEADRRDEILCPTDLDWKDPLRDDWLRGTFDALRPGVSLTVVMDCCHSGTNTRAINPPDAPVIPRYLPNPWDIMAAESGRRLRGRVAGRLRRTPHGKRGPDVVAVTMPETLITGCRDTQTSADAFIGGSYNGALTWSLVAAIRAVAGKLSYRELHARALALLSKERYDQVPQLEGRRTRLDAAFLSAEA
ncbi:MAG TPA: caspase family protein [Vicinamibacteria bacterium]|nr:caspase family protein [Vicinamibacteria bacterium]